MKGLPHKIYILAKTGFFHVVGSSAINKIISFLSSIILVRILTKNEYGVFTYAWNIYSIILLLNGMGIESGVLQISSEKGGDRNYTEKIAKYGTQFGLRFNVLLVIMILCVSLFAPLKIESSRPLFLLLSLLPLFQLLFNMTTIYLRAEKRNQEYSKLLIIHSGMMLITSAGFAFCFREYGLVAGHYAANITCFILGYTLFHVKLLGRQRISNVGSDTKPLLKIAFITMINNGLSQVLYLLDVFVLGIVDPQETILAGYKVATMIPAALTFIPQALIIYIYPYFAEHRNDPRWCLQKYKKITLLFSGFNVLVSAILYIFAPIIIQLFFGEQYLDSLPVFRILAINYFFAGTFRIVSGNLLVTQRKLKFNLFVAIFSSGINILADYWFVQWWGAIGAAYATLIVVLVSSMLSTSYLIFTFIKGIRKND